MHRNYVWLLFLGLISLYALYYTGTTLNQLYQYNRLEKQVEIKDISWAIRSFAADALSPQAEYHYEYEGKTYSGRTVWSERYLNEWTATEAIHRMSPTTTWIDPANPSYSSMEKSFPLKPTIYMVLLWGLLAYFIILGKRYGQYSS
jgi:hypothetical protein